MRYKRVNIEALGYELPPQVVSTAELEDRLAPVYSKLGIPVGQLEEMTGIAERRWWDSGFKVSDGAAAAASRALSRSPVKPEDLEVLIYAGVCRDSYEPATACRVASRVGVSQDAAVYDISNACLGVLNGIIDIANRIELGQIRAGMVVSCETAREINEIMIAKMLEDVSVEAYTRGLATLTGGSGAVAVLLTDGSFGTRKRRLIGAVNTTEPEHHELCRWGVERIGVGALKELMRTDSAAVLRFGVELGMRTWRRFLERWRWSVEMVDKVICHQVGEAHRKQILSTLGLDENKDFSTFKFLGNIGTVSLPLTAALAEERGFLKPGDRVGFLGIGSGLNCLMLGLEW